MFKFSLLSISLAFVSGPLKRADVTTAPSMMDIVLEFPNSLPANERMRFIRQIKFSSLAVQT